MFAGLSRLRLLSVLLTLVLVAPPLGGRLSARPAVPAASRQPSGTPNTLDGVACPRPSTCVAVGEGGTILRSTDGGSTWRRQPSATTSELDGVACLSPSTCVAVGLGGTILRSTDGGSTWRRQSSGTSLSRVACPRLSTCRAAGGRGKIVRSTDEGRTCHRHPSGTLNTLHDLTCLSPSTCAAL